MLLFEPDGAAISKCGVEPLAAVDLVGEANGFASHRIP
jgi:hypothetical protein